MTFTLTHRRNEWASQTWHFNRKKRHQIPTVWHELCPVLLLHTPNLVLKCPKSQLCQIWHKIPIIYQLQPNLASQMPILASNTYNLTHDIHNRVSNIHNLSPITKSGIKHAHSGIEYLQSGIQYPPWYIKYCIHHLSPITKSGIWCDHFDINYNVQSKNQYHGMKHPLSKDGNILPNVVIQSN